VNNANNVGGGRHRPHPSPHPSPYPRRHPDDYHVEHNHNFNDRQVPKQPESRDTEGRGAAAAAAAAITTIRRTQPKESIDTSSMAALKSSIAQMTKAPVDTRIVDEETWSRHPLQKTETETATTGW